jgi:hypothetical protein
MSVAAAAVGDAVDVVAWPRELKAHATGQVFVRGSVTDADVDALVGRMDDLGWRVTGLVCTDARFDTAGSMAKLLDHDARRLEAVVLSDVAVGGGGGGALAAALTKRAYPALRVLALTDSGFDADSVATLKCHFGPGGGGACARLRHPHVSGG